MVGTGAATTAVAGYQYSLDYAQGGPHLCDPSKHLLYQARFGGAKPARPGGIKPLSALRSTIDQTKNPGTARVVCLVELSGIERAGLPAQTGSAVR